MSRRAIKYKYTRYYLEWLQMPRLERCIKRSWNLIFGGEKENFSPLIWSLVNPEMGHSTAQGCHGPLKNKDTSI